MWRNGRRARFRSVCPKGRGGSTPPIPTSYGRPLSAESADRGRSSFLLRGPRPRTPRVAAGAGGGGGRRPRRVAVGAVGGMVALCGGLGLAALRSLARLLGWAGCKGADKTRV